MVRQGLDERRNDQPPSFVASGTELNQLAAIDACPARNSPIIRPKPHIWLARYLTVTTSLSYTAPIWLIQARLGRESGMDDRLDAEGLVDAVIDREGGFVDNPADKGGPTCFGITQAVARAHGYAGPMRLFPRSEAVAIYLRLYWLRPRLDEVAARSAPPRRRAVRHRRQHGPGGRRYVPPARADRAQPQRHGLSGPDPRRPCGTGDARRARCISADPRTKAAARPCCCARSKRSRASATFASPSAGQPMRRSSMGGWRTGSVSAETAPSLRTFAKIGEYPMRALPPASYICRGSALHLRPARLGRGHVLRRCCGVHGRAPHVGRLEPG